MTSTTFKEIEALVDELSEAAFTYGSEEGQGALDQGSWKAIKESGEKHKAAKAALIARIQKEVSNV